MELINLNFLTIIIFLVLFFIIICGAFLLYIKLNLFDSKFKGLTNNRANFIKYIFLFLSFIILLFSVFGIKVSKNISNNISEGIDIVFVLDVSKSMNVADIESKNYIYTRLDFAKKAIADYVTKNPENKYSLVIFTGVASSVVPLTNNSDFFLSVLDNVDYTHFPTQGTNFYEALSSSHNRLVISNSKSNAIIFLSDGGDDGDLLLDYLTQENYTDLKNEKIKYFIAGVGTKEGGKIITGKDFFGRFTYQTYNNEYVISKLNEDNLKNLASMLSGQYQKLDKYSHIELFSKSLDKIEKRVNEENNKTDGIDASRKLGFISFIFFFIYLSLSLYGEKIYLYILKNE